MRRNTCLLAVGTVAASLFLGCNISEPARSTAPAVLTGDTHLTILQTSDLHSHANGDGPMSATAVASTPGPEGGYARIAAYVGSVRSAADQDHPVLLVDSGNWSMGTVYDLTLTSSPLQLTYMTALNYDCGTLGNSEFDYTPKGLATILAAAKASAFGFAVPIVASNLVLNGDADLAPLVGTSILPSYTKTLANGLKVGFIGLMGEAAAADAPSATPVTFTPLSQDYATVQALVNQLRSAQGCKVVVALDSVGTSAATGGYTGEDVSLAENVTGIDVIASGHSQVAFANGSANHPVANGAWTTQIISCGGYGSNVARIDLSYHFAAGNTTVDASSNLPMTDATLAAAGVTTAAEFSGFVRQADQALNLGLGTLFQEFFSGYSASSLNTGLYAPVGMAAQDMVPNSGNAVLCPNGLGDLCADADRNVPNGIIQTVAQALVKAGWTGSPSDPNLPAIMAAANLTGFDLTPFSAGLVPTGVIRDSLLAGTPIVFANAYDVLPLGISPDTTQADPIGYPMLSTYLTAADLAKLCALQLVAQSNLIDPSYYLNLSGLSYQLEAANLASFFQAATAAAVLQVTEQKAAAGSAQAGAAMAGLAAMASDSGQSLLAAAAAGNPYAVAMVQLADASYSASSPDLANLPVLATVAADAAADAAQGSHSLDTLLVNAAIAAVSQVSSFAASDPTCVGSATALSGSARYRVAADLYCVFMMGAIQSQFGVTITPYAAATGTAVLSESDLAGAMANRINATPGAAALVELKEWEALLTFLTTAGSSGGLGGSIGVAYASTATFTDFTDSSAFGTAVTTRNADYGSAVLPMAGQLAGTLQTLTAAP
jgi:2',3'-cyclic-nucleotide 2'-phosphodiesterase (5'-nucleotidase family)